MAAILSKDCIKDKWANALPFCSLQECVYVFTFTFDKS